MPWQRSHLCCSIAAAMVLLCNAEQFVVQQPKIMQPHHHQWHKTDDSDCPAAPPLSWRNDTANLALTASLNTYLEGFPLTEEYVSLRPSLSFPSLGESTDTVCFMFAAFLSKRPL